MITKVVMPQLSLSMREGIVTRWLKKEGDYVNQGEPLCEIEADKASTEIEAPVSGYVKKIVAQEGEEFPVRKVMVYLGDAGDVVPDEELEPGKAAATTQAPSTPSAEPKAPQKPGRILASPVAKKLAAELGVDLSQVVGTGPDGMIGKEDVLAAHQAQGAVPAAAAPAPAAPAVKGIKKLVAERMRESYLDAPHIHLTLTCNMAQAVEKRKAYNERSAGGPHLTVSDLIVWACSRALEKHPLLNASYRDGSIATNSEVNINLAVDSENGLLVPVIRNANRLSVGEIAQRRQELVERAKQGKQTPDDLSGGTFTITNLGMFEIEQFDAIINPGQAAILSVGMVKPTPVVDEVGGIVVRPMMTLTLACDHRIADGADGARFLAAVKAILEKPEEMFAGI